MRGLGRVAAGQVMRLVQQAAYQGTEVTITLLDDGHHRLPDSKPEVCFRPVTRNDLQTLQTGEDC